MNIFVLEGRCIHEPGNFQESLANWPSKIWNLAETESMAMSDGPHRVIRLLPPTNRKDYWNTEVAAKCGEALIDNLPEETQSVIFMGYRTARACFPMRIVPFQEGLIVPRGIHWICLPSNINVDIGRKEIIASKRRIYAGVDSSTQRSGSRVSGR